MLIAYERYDTVYAVTVTPNPLLVEDLTSWLACRTAVTQNLEPNPSASLVLNDNSVIPTIGGISNLKHPSSNTLPPQSCQGSQPLTRLKYDDTTPSGFVSKRGDGFYNPANPSGLDLHPTSRIHHALIVRQAHYDGGSAVIDVVELPR